MNRISAADATEIFDGVSKKFCELIGIDSTLQLIYECGGTTLSIPKVRRDGNDVFERLSEVVGRNEAIRLCEQFGSNGGRTYIPRLSSAMKYARAHQIRERFRELRKHGGASAAVRVLSVETRMTNRNVWRILSMLDAVDSGTPCLVANSKEKPPSSIDGDLYAVMPEQARHLCSVLGPESAIQLLNEFGGQIIHIPKKATNFTSPTLARIAVTFGESVIDMLAKEFGGEHLYLPMLTDAIRKMRDRTICRDFERMLRSRTANEAVATLARRHKISDRQVWRILKKPLDATARRETKRVSKSFASERRSPTVTQRDAAIVAFYESMSSRATLARIVDVIVEKYCVSERTAYRILARERSVIRPVTLRGHAIEAECDQRDSEKSPTSEAVAKFGVTHERNSLGYHRESRAPRFVSAAVTGLGWAEAKAGF
ncbi:TPA: hypothetical protein QDB40_006735 [Burkholderia vietnamiensis]|uniref:Mor transcription activator family protein n=1 Tax=Burkholderia vietnamiensis TaxID=60552 RepID=UPI0015942EB6|nr:Mor transcription activator family protein [Burkholderia vietnamiensis]HDR9035972.1 hypothetical protein [Burkholderia vietnamiensis]HDR9172624.1 hypothetical protein [Burkholderia vietnamiensis]